MSGVLYPEFPITRVEAYLDAIAKNGGGSGRLEICLRHVMIPMTMAR